MTSKSVEIEFDAKQSNESLIAKSDGENLDSLNKMASDHFKIKSEYSSGNVTVVVDGFGILENPLTDRESNIVQRYTFFNRNRMSVQVNFCKFFKKKFCCLK